MDSVGEGEGGKIWENGIETCKYHDEDLTEAVALGHDLGHTPFGHAGEEAMKSLYSSDFTHYKQSLRVVEQLENNGKGLNLTWEVRDGIVNHTGSHVASTLEGVIVKFADRIAYINHDIDDACRAGILRTEEIPLELRRVLGETHSERINTMVLSVILASTDQPEIRMGEEIQQATNELRSFLFSNVYSNSAAKTEDGRAKGILAALYELFVKQPEKMPAFYYERCQREGVERSVCDFISGMTDRYVIELYKELYIPKVWKT